MVLVNNIETTPQQKLRSEQLKAAANKSFSEGNYKSAADTYTEAICYHPSNPILYSNRALAYIRQEFYAVAKMDAEWAIDLDPTFVKAYYRRAFACMALGQLREAVKDFRAVCKMAPQERQARTYLSTCEKEIKRIEFEKAISFDTEYVLALTRIGNIDEIVVEDSYDGPHLDPAGITLDFVKALLEHMKKEKKLHKKYLYQIMRAVKEIFEPQDSIVDVPIGQGQTLTVCGDIHGQFYDVLHVFEMNGLPSETNMYLWNGDFVDRGSFSVECIVTLFAFKMLYPSSIFLSRGNHETNDMNRTYGFEGEVKAKYTDLTFQFFSEIFNAVPLGNLIQNKILVIHGGLFSRDDVTIDELRKINRFRQPGNTGLMCEVLWSDPQDEDGRAPSMRGAGVRFGPDITKAFLELNDLDMIIRSHEVKQQGYEIQHNGKCVTIFSAPNYCDSGLNKGAYIRISPQLKLDYVQFEAVPHPPVKAMKYANSMFNSGFM